MVTRYQYYHLIPEGTANKIEKAVKAFAVRQGTSFDLWYHDLPIWVIRQTQEDKTSRVVIEAIYEATDPRPRAILSFTPDLYVRQVKHEKGSKEISLKTSPPEQNVKLRDKLEIDNITKMEEILTKIQQAWLKIGELKIEGAGTLRRKYPDHGS